MSPASQRVSAGTSSSTEQMSGSVRAMRPFVPAKDFALSRRFYADLGFAVDELGDKLAELRLGPHSFLLQDYYVEQWAGNFMMHMLVEDVATWWRHVESLDLGGRYGVPPPQAPKRERSGLDVAYVIDPSGVLWHIASASK